jgi:glucokinase
MARRGPRRRFDLVLLTLGTGIGGGIIMDGRILHGQVGMAGEFGHMTVIPSGNPCGCGNDGCLEKHASATAITAMARLLQLGENLSAAQVFQIAGGNGEMRKRRGIFSHRWVRRWALLSPISLIFSMRRFIC